MEEIMKKKILSVVLCVALLVAIGPKPKAHADAMTAAMIGQLAFGMASSWGINFTASNATGQGVSDFMTSQVESYVNSNGGSLGSLFVGNAAVNLAGKLVVGQQLYEGIKNFVSWLGDKYNLGTIGSIFSEGSMGGISIGEKNTVLSEPTSSGLSVVGGNQVNDPGSFYDGMYYSLRVYQDGELMGSLGQDYGFFLTGAYSMTPISTTAVRIEYEGVKPGQTKTYVKNISLAKPEEKVNGINWSVPENWSEPQPLPQNKEWQGDFSDTPGFADPPTDLPDFLSRIPVGVAENNLAVTGEIVEADTGGDMPIPSPSPSPSPSYNKSNIALIIAEILALINSLSGDTAVDEEAVEQVAQEVAEQAQTLPDTITQTATQTQTAIQDATQTMTDTMTQTQTQTQTAIQDATQTITDTLTQTQTQTQTAIQDATQTITDTLTETQTEIKDAIQDQTDTLTDVRDKLEDATKVPDRTSWEKVKKDLHGVFPFCIPWDIYGMLTAFSAEAKAPHFEWPFNVPSIGLEYTIDLDFSEFDPVAQTLRTVELIAFSIGLAILTSKVIRW